MAHPRATEQEDKMKRLVTALPLLILVIMCIVASRFDTPARNFLAAKGYNVVHAYGGSRTYVLTRDKLMTFPYSMDWGLQTQDPSQYLGRRVYVYRYTVTGHPLDNWQQVDRNGTVTMRSDNATTVSVFVVDNVAVGGTSHPVLDQQLILLGGFWSIDGKDFDEVHPTGYEAWSRQWKAKFGG